MQHNFLPSIQSSIIPTPWRTCFRQRLVFERRSSLKHCRWLDVVRFAVWTPYQRCDVKCRTRCPTPSIRTSAVQLVSHCETKVEREDEVDLKGILTFCVTPLGLRPRGCLLIEVVDLLSQMTEEALETTIVLTCDVDKSSRGRAPFQWGQAAYIRVT